MAECFAELGVLLQHTHHRRERRSERATLASASCFMHSRRIQSSSSSRLTKKTVDYIGYTTCGVHMSAAEFTRNTLLVS